MNIVCLDMEGVLVPEIWIAFAGFGIDFRCHVHRGKNQFDVDAALLVPTPMV